MAQANTTLRIAELDFDQIKTNLKDFLRSQQEFQDFDFEGSGMSILLDVLAYNTHYNAFYLNMVGNEMFIDTAQLRNSIISHAKLMNYVPRGTVAPTAVVNITVTPSSNEDQDATTLTMPAYTTFLSEPLDGIAYQFMTTEADTSVKVGNSFTFSNVSIKQGELVTMTYTVSPTNTKRRYVIPSSTVDLDTVVITVQESAVNTFTTLYTQSEDLTTANSSSTIYFIEENPDSNGSYTVTFGDGVIGKQLSNGNIIFIRYLDCQGDAANKANTFTLTTPINGYDDNVTVTSVSAAAGGAPKETIEQIRKRAPVHYTVQNRAVTVNDFKSIITSDYPNISSVAVWGGEENVPPIYGKIFISLNPIDDYEITQTEKDRIVNEIISNRTVLTVIPEIVDPDYVYVLALAKANYDSRLSVYDETQLSTLIREAILDYRDNYLRTFDSVYRNSVLQRKIDDVDRSINSSELNIYLQKRFQPTLDETKNYELKFNLPLYKGSPTNRLYSFPAVTILDNNNVERDVYFEEVPDSYSGIDSIDVINPGQEYTSVPTVTISGDGTGAAATAKIVNGKLASITVDSRGSNYTRATVSITGGDGSGATAVAILQNRIGDLRTYYYQSNGEKVIVNPTAGTVNYEEGIVYLTNFTPLAIIENDNYPNDTVTINISPLNETIYPVRNRILELDENDSSSIQVTMVDENGI
jgi:hypothetical protein